MNKLIYGFGITIATILLAGCGKSKIDQTRYYNYTANKSYVGTHPMTNFSAAAFLKEASGELQMQVDLIGCSDTLHYPVSIHEYDSTALYHYNPTPFLNMGEYKGEIPLIKIFSTLDFATFANEFKGYLIVQDPLNKSHDTSTLLIYGKIGSDW